MSPGGRAGAMLRKLLLAGCCVTPSSQGSASDPPPTPVEAMVIPNGFMIRSSVRTPAHLPANAKGVIFRATGYGSDQ